MHRTAGTSLLELVVMLAVVAVLCAGAALSYVRQSAQAGAKQAKVELERIARELECYAWDVPARLLEQDGNLEAAFRVAADGSHRGLCVYGRAAVAGLHDACVAIDLER